MWANTSNRNMSKLQSCQIMHAVLSAGRKLRPYFLEVSLWHLNALRAQHRTILPLNLLNDLTSVCEKLETLNHYTFPYLTVSASGQRSFYYRTVKIWNSSDNEFKLSKDVLSFKRKLKSKLLCSA